MRLGVEPEAVLAAYRVGDSPINAVSPMNAYFALIVAFAMKYQKDAGVGTVIALMLPYVVALFVSGRCCSPRGTSWGFRGGSDATLATCEKVDHRQIRMRLINAGASHAESRRAGHWN